MTVSNKRRVHHRIETSLQISYMVDMQWQAVSLADIGLGGALIHTERLAPMGSEVWIQLIHNGQSVNTLAKVIREFTEGNGVQFLDLNAVFIDVLVDALTPLVDEDVRALLNADVSLLLRPSGP